MARSDDLQERTEQATPKRLREAREKGQVPRSRELNTMTVLLAAAGGMLVFGPRMAEGFYQFVRGGLTLNRNMVTDSAMLYPAFEEAIRQGLWLMVPLLMVMAVAAIMASIALGGVAFSAKAMAFRWDRLDPLTGLGRVFSLSGLMEVVKALAKFLVVAAVAVIVLWHDAPAFLGLGSESLAPALMQAGSLMGWGFLFMSAALILVAVADVPFQLWQYAKNLRMTRQEIRDELKETEGQPEVKGRQRRLQREIAQRRMMEEVPRADVVVTNPTHYAVALRYNESANGAPRVVAKGADQVAQRIRELAEKNHVVMYSAPPLARALYVHTRLGEEIPAALYVAVAQLLAYVYQLKAGTAAEGVGLAIAVPAEYAVLPKEAE